MRKLLLIIALVLSVPSLALDHHENTLAALDKFIGTWRGEVGEGTVDVVSYEWIMRGKAMRIMHAINDGVYGGETLVHFDEASQSIIYRYVTTDSFYTEGTITPTKDGFDAHEKLFGKTGGITETRAGYNLKGDEIHVWSQFLKDGEWTEISKAVFKRAPDAQVLFND